MSTLKPPGIKNSELCDVDVGSDLVFAYLNGFGWVFFAVETHIVDGVLVLHPIVQNNYLQEKIHQGDYVIKSCR